MLHHKFQWFSLNDPWLASIIILPMNSPSAAISIKTTGFFTGPETSLFAAIATEQYFIRFFICNILTVVVLKTHQRIHIRISTQGYNWRTHTARDMFFYDQGKESHKSVELKSTATPCGLMSQNNSLYSITL